MRWTLIPLGLTGCLLAACSNMNSKTAPSAPSASTSAPASSTASVTSLQQFQKRAEKFGAVISLPVFEASTNNIRTTVTNTILTGNAALDRIGQLAPGTVNFSNTLGALDTLGFQIALAANRIGL